jgi:hypothetical protein
LPIIGIKELMFFKDYNSGAVMLYFSVKYFIVIQEEKNGRITEQTTISE